MAMVCAAGAAALVLCYRSLLEVLSGRWQDGVIFALLATVCGIGTWILCKNRDDLLLIDSHDSR